MGTAKVLIVDDDKRIVGILRAMLEDSGYVVRSAHNGRDCLEALETEPCDLVLCDVFMPEMDGIEACMQINAEFPRTRVIAMSGVVRDVDYLRVIECLGADAVLTKPFTQQQLLAAVTYALGAGRA